MKLLHPFLFFLFAANLWGQAGGDSPLAHLSSQQAQLAEQAQRLEKILGLLEKQAKEEGIEERAMFYRQALSRLQETGAKNDLAQRLKSVAQDLLLAKTGPALQKQTELVQFLEDLLQQLIQQRQEQRLQEIIKEAEAREKTLRSLQKEQEELRKDTTGNSSTDDFPTEQLQQRQKNLREKIEDAIQEFEKQGRQDDSLNQAESSAKRAEKSLEESDQNDDAVQEQEQVEKSLQQAAENAANEAEIAQQKQEQKELLHLLTEAKSLFKRHLAVHESLIKSGVTKPEEVLSRSQRIPLRKWAKTERELQVDVGKLLFEIQQSGADAFPFYLEILKADHGRLAKRLGPPKYRKNSATHSLSSQLKDQWVEFIDALETEAERQREKTEAKEGEGSGEDRLIGMAEEIQLLKRLEIQIRDRIKILHRQQSLLHDAGFAFNEEEFEELEELFQRHEKLRRMFESVLERYEMAGTQTPQSQDNTTPEEEEL